MAPIASRKQTSARKAGQGGSYSWGDAMDLAEFEFIGYFADPQVSVCSAKQPQQQSHPTPLQNTLSVQISDAAHFPQLGSAFSQVRKRRSDVTEVTHHANRPSPPPMAPPPPPLRRAGKRAAVDEVTSLMIDWSTSGLRLQRGAVVQQLLRFSSSSLRMPDGVNAVRDAVALMIDWSVEGTTSQRTAACQQSSFKGDEASQHCANDVKSKLSQTVKEDALTMMIDWSRDGMKSQRTAAFHQSPSDQQRGPTEQTSQETDAYDGVSTDYPIIVLQQAPTTHDAILVSCHSNTSSLLESKDVAAETISQQELTSADVSTALATDVDGDLAEEDLTSAAENRNNITASITTIEQTSHEENEWAFVEETGGAPSNEEDVSFTVVPSMHVREMQTGFNVQRSRNTFARRPRKTASGKENDPFMIDWAAEGNLAFQQIARKLCVNAAHLGLHQVPNARSQTPQRVVKTYSRADQSFAKTANNVMASRPRRDRSRSLVTQKRGR